MTIAGFDMDYQVLFNLALGGFSFLFGFLLRNIWAEIKQLQDNERNTLDRIAELRSVVDRSCITREEFNGGMNRLNSKLDSMVEILHQKADR